LEVIVGYCPECEATIEEEFEDVGEVISCPECGVELEVISIDPVEFDLAPVEDEDDDDEDEDEFQFDETDDEDDWDDEDDEDLEDEDDERNDY
jgi:alpha-aminoadipate carrier protein LysW